MQTFGLGVYCTLQANILRMAMHALYGVVQSGTSTQQSAEELKSLMSGK